MIKKKKKFRVDFAYDACILFHYRTEFYWKEHGHYNYNGTISKFHVNQDGYVLDLIIKKHTNDEEFIMYHEELKTKLPVVYVDL